MSLPDHLVAFVEELRARGVPVGPSETVDAGQVLSVIDMFDREVLREGLACALLRRSTHRPTFDGLFDLWFPAAIGDRTASADELPDNIADVRKLLAQLLADDAARTDQVAALLVDQFGRYETANGASFSAYQALKDLAPETLIRKIIDGMRAGSTDFDEEVARRTAKARIAAFRGQVEGETRRRVAERQGRDRVANYGVPRQAEQVEFLRASAMELEQLRRSVHGLARLLASRLAARRRRARAGEIDLRKTLRKSMSTGGVPITLARRKPHPGRPELVVLCDVSGSVAGFSHFTLLLVHALREQFSRVRIFAFIDATDEVTKYFDPGADLGTAMTRIIKETRLIRIDGHSDYGNAIRQFADDFGDSVTARTSLLVLGDGRNNYRDTGIVRLRALVETAKHAYWLNPEAKQLWGSGDSDADKYAEVMDMRECRSAQQLTAVVSSLLPV